MKKIRRHVLDRNRIFLIVWCLLIGCGSTANHFHVSAGFDKADINRVGLLVTRVGCQLPLGVSQVPISLGWDYSIRKPQIAEVGAEGDIRNHPVPVYIEEKLRLYDAFPFYPKTAPEPVPLLDKFYYTEFYGNLTPFIYRAVGLVLEEKAYTVVDAREVSRKWEKPIAEMKMEEIVRSLSKDADALLVIHYMDVGTTAAQEGEITHVDRGLTDIEYSLALFDCKTKERLVLFSKDHAPSFKTALSKDPIVMMNPQFKGKVVVKDDPNGRAVVVGLSPKEQVRFLTTYISRGLTYNLEEIGPVKWTGIAEIIP